MPPAAFSPLTTTKSACSSLRSSASIVRITRRPAAPTTSPTKRIPVKAQTLVHDSPPAHTWGMQQDPEEVGPGGVENPPIEPRPHDAHAPAPGAAPRAVAPVVVPRWIQAVVLPLTIVGAYLLLRAAGPVALIFIVAALVALLLNPFVVILQRARVPRGLAVGCVYLTMIVVLAALVAVLANPIGDQVSRFSDSVPGIVDDANGELSDLQGWLDENGIDIEIAKQGETALETLGARVTEGSGELVNFTRDAVTVLIEGSIALILIVVLSVYMLVYGERIGAAVRSVVPRGDGTPG